MKRGWRLPAKTLEGATCNPGVLLRLFPFCFICYRSTSAGFPIQIYTGDCSTSDADSHSRLSCRPEEGEQQWQDKQGWGWWSWSSSLLLGGWGPPGNEMLLLGDRPAPDTAVYSPYVPPCPKHGWQLGEQIFLSFRDWPPSSYPAFCLMAGSWFSLHGGTLAGRMSADWSK